MEVKNYTTAEAAAHFALKRDTIQKAAKRGALEGTRRGSIWFFTEDQIRAWQARTADWRAKRGK